MISYKVDIKGEIHEISCKEIDDLNIYFEINGSTVRKSRISADEVYFRTYSGARKMLAALSGIKRK